MVVTDIIGGICRLNGAELIRVNEGEEPNDLCCLLGNRKDYISMINGMRVHASICC